MEQTSTDQVRQCGPIAWGGNTQISTTLDERRDSTYEPCGLRVLKPAAIGRIMRIIFLCPRHHPTYCVENLLNILIKVIEFQHAGQKQLEYE